MTNLEYWNIIKIHYCKSWQHTHLQADILQIMTTHSPSSWHFANHDNTLTFKLTFLQMMTTHSPSSWHFCKLSQHTHLQADIFANDDNTLTFKLTFLQIITTHSPSSWHFANYDNTHLQADIFANYHNTLTFKLTFLPKVTSPETVKWSSSKRSGMFENRARKSFTYKYLKTFLLAY